MQEDIECHHHLLCFVCFWFAKPVAAGCAPLWCPFRGEKPTPCKHECLILWLFVLFLLPLPGSWWTTRFHMCCVHPLFCVSCFPPRVFFGETTTHAYPTVVWSHMSNADMMWSTKLRRCAAYTPCFVRFVSRETTNAHIVSPLPLRDVFQMCLRHRGEGVRTPMFPTPLPKRGPNPSG